MIKISYITPGLLFKYHHTIEHVARYMGETTTKTGLKIQYWFDRKQFPANAGKRESVEEVLTRKQLDESAKGRFIHPFGHEIDMYNQNYTVYPPKIAKAAVLDGNGLITSEQYKRTMFQHQRIVVLLIGGQ